MISFRFCQILVSEESLYFCHTIDSNIFRQMHATASPMVLYWGDGVWLDEG